MSSSRNLNQHKNMSLLKAGRHFNLKIGIYYFCQFTILIPFFKVLGRGIFDNKKSNNKLSFSNLLF